MPKCSVLQGLQCMYMLSVAYYGLPLGLLPAQVNIDEDGGGDGDNY